MEHTISTQRILAFHSIAYIALFTFIFSFGSQLSISIFFVTPVAYTDNLKIINECF